MTLRTCVSYTAALTTIAIVSAQAQAQNGDIVARWTFETSVPTTAGPHAAEVGTGSASGFHANAAAVYSNPSGNGSAESFSSNNWAVGDYYQFQTSTLGLDEIGFVLDHTSSGTGPRDFQFQYSTDGSTFTDFGSPYMNAGTTWSSGTQSMADTHAFDLRSVTGLNNQANVYFRVANSSTTSVGGATVAATGTSRIDNVTVFSNFIPPDDPPPPPDPRLPRPRDVVLGLSINNAGSLELVRGPVEMDGAEFSPGPWTTPFLQSVEFDNFDGVRHNVRGNLLAADFGNQTNGGSIVSLATNGPIPAPAGQVIGNTRPAPDNVGHDGSLALARLGGLSVSPDNTKIAVTGFENGRVYVYDYTAGDTLGAGAAAANGRQTTENTLVSGSTQGTAWLDNDTVLAFSSFGSLVEVDAASMASTEVGTVTTPFLGSDFTGLAYNPEISPLVFAAYSGFDAMATPTVQNRVYIFDPANNYSLVNEINLNGSLSDSLREIALDEDGNLFIGVRGSEIEFIPNVDENPAAIADDSSIDWYDGATFSGFNGLDIGFGEEPDGLTGDYNNDGKVNAADYVVWRKNNINGQQGYDDWRMNFGAPDGGGSALSGAVPEPAAVALLLIGLVCVCHTRRRG
jgi:hypothetical protein